MNQSKVILVIVEKRAASLDGVTDELIESLYSKFGALKAVKIFARGSNVKCFVEFKDLDGRRRALEADSSRFTDVFKVKHYHSKKKFVAKDIEIQNPKRKKTASVETDEICGEEDISDLVTGLPEGRRSQHSPPDTDGPAAQDCRPQGFFSPKVWGPATTFSPCSRTATRGLGFKQPSKFLPELGLNRSLTNPVGQPLSKCLPPAPRSQRTVTVLPRQEPKTTLWLSSNSADGLNVNNLISFVRGLGKLVRVMSSAQFNYVLFEFVEASAAAEAGRLIEARRMRPTPTVYEPMTVPESDELLSKCNFGSEASEWVVHFPTFPGSAHPARFAPSFAVFSNLPPSWTYEQVELLLSTVLPPRDLLGLTAPCLKKRIFVAEYASAQEALLVSRTLDGQRIDEATLQAHQADLEAMARGLGATLQPFPEQSEDADAL